MNTLVLYDYPPSPGGLATQGDLLFRGLTVIGVETSAAHLASAQKSDRVRQSKGRGLTYGFNEWISATDGTPKGVDRQTWSSAMDLYATDCVR